MVNVTHKQANAFEIDAYTQHVMSKIDAEVFSSLNLVQLAAIREAISANAPFRKHPVDIRGTIPLYFFKFYFVFLLGKDRRFSTREKETLRRQAAGSMSLIVFLYTAFCVAIPAVLVTLYGLKTLMGVDVFEGFHLGDLWR